VNSKKSWDEFVESNYAYLLKIARRYTADDADLVSHVYLRVIDKRFPDKPMGYFCTALFIEATRGQFKKIYRIEERGPLPDIADKDDLQTALRLEQMELFLDRLPFFDKTIARLYIEGYNLADVARESGIQAATIYQSLSRTKKILANVIRQSRNAGGAFEHL
jgi:RNA polymerase sigma factor (sigma-70 family)